MKIQWNGLHLSSTGYGEVTRFYLNVLREMGHDICVHQYEFLGDRQNPYIFGTTQARILQELISHGRHVRPDVLFDCSFYGLEKPRVDCGRRVGQVMYEVDLPNRYTELCNACDDVIVPGPWGKELFVDRGGVTVPTHVVPYGIWDMPQMTRSRGNLYRFVSVFSWSERKNPQALIAAYLLEFNADDKVELVVKSPSPNSRAYAHKIIREVCAQEGLSTGYLPRIEIVEGTQERAAVWELYQRSSCYVSAHCAEGIGVPMLEAQACGLPVVATDFSESTWFVTEQTGYPVRLWKPTEAEMMKKHMRLGDYSSKMWWADVSVSGLRTAMRRAYDHQDEAWGKGAAGRLNVLQNFRPQNTTQAFKEMGL